MLVGFVIFIILILSNYNFKTLKMRILLTSLSSLFFIFFTTYVFSQPRETTSLNNNWEFSLNNADIKSLDSDSVQWETINVPHTWNNKDIQSGEKVYYGTGWYKKELPPGQFKKDREYFLRFEGVGQYAEVYMNSKFVGEHLGSYSAFVFNITRFILPDTTNTLLVKVNNELNLSYPKDNFLFGIYGGIYRPVSLISTGELHIALIDNASSGVFIHQNEVSHEKASLTIVTDLKNDGSEIHNVKLKQSLYSQEGELIATSTEDFSLYPGGIKPVNSRMEIGNPHLWNGRKDPYLYRMETELIQNGRVLDKISNTTGIRFYRIDKEKGFILNGEPYRLYGVCRHQEWENKGNALLPKHHKKDMELIYEIGATSIRLAHYEQADYIYSLADSMGILIWAEIPFINGYKEGADGNAIQQLTELIKQRFNHPSIFVWGMHNEVLKNNIVSQPVNLTIKLNNLAKTLDPSRYTVSVSNLWWLFNHRIHQHTDLQGFNQYTGWYGGKPEELSKWIKNYHTAKPDIRFSISEYGAGGNIDQQSNDIQTTPDPKCQFFPEPYMTHYHEVTYSAIKRNPFIWGSYVWNMFDFSVPEWDRGGIKERNHKGLITYDRKTKKDAFFWYKANWSDEPVLYLVGRRNNQQKKGKFKISAYSNIGAPELFIDGKSMGKMGEDNFDVKYSKEISFKKGKHLIEVKQKHKETVLNDSYILYIEKKIEK